MLILDTHEQKSPVAFETLKFTVGPLKVGDLLDTDHKVLIEFKIGKDAHDYKRMQDELTRMNYAEFADFQKHIIFIGHALPFVDQINEYKKMVSFAFDAGVKPHHVLSLALLESKVKKILNGKMGPLQAHSYSKKIGSILQREIRCFPGISEPNSYLLEPIVRKWRWTWDIESIDGEMVDGVCRILGLKKDGSPTKLCDQFILYLRTGVEPQ